MVYNFIYLSMAFLGASAPLAFSQQAARAKGAKSSHYFGIYMEGILLIDKPVGPSSFDVVHKVRKVAGTKRVGHAGTLDPLASGLLVIALGPYTKLAGYLTESAKVYETEIRLGITTSTDDGEGEIIKESPIEHISAVQVQEALRKFVGKIKQAPPQFSAIKINGVRAYKMARESIDFEIAPREVEIISIDIIKIALPTVHIKVHCSKGTYIRSLARDVGETLGCGAMASSIRRIKSGSFCLSQALSFENLEVDAMKHHILRECEALGSLFSYSISDEDMSRAKHGRPFLAPSHVPEDISVALYDNKIVAITKRENNYCTILRGF